MESNFDTILINLCELSKKNISVNDMINSLTKMIKKLNEDNQDKISDLQSMCIGCIENQPNQLAHMDIGGCMYDNYDDYV